MSTQGSRSPSAELAAANAWLGRDDEAKAAIDGLHELMPVQRRIVRGGIKLDRLERAASSDERIDLALAQFDGGKGQSLLAGRLRLSRLRSAGERGLGLAAGAISAIAFALRI